MMIVVGHLKMGLALLFCWIFLLPQKHAHGKSKHGVYVELFGKSGVYGFGYELELLSKFQLGVVGSAYFIDNERLTTLSPYMGINLLGEKRHRWFLHGGPTLVHRKISSPVPEWSGLSTTNLSGQISSGYEYRLNRMFFRGYLMAVVGEGGFSPWFGLSAGARF